MIGAMFSSSPGERHAYLRSFVAQCGAKLVIYACPKNLLEVSRGSGIPAKYIPFEDLTKTDEWLTANAMIGPETALLMENVSRYPRITSEKFRHLQKLSMQVPHRAVVDIAPMTIGMEYLYTVFSYLDRSILGFAHWYAWRENNMEQTEDGSVIRAHDPALCAKKLSNVSEIGTGTVLVNRQTVTVPISSDERASYQILRDKCFNDRLSPIRIVTRLADLTHVFRTRQKVAIEATGSARSLILTNLTSYANLYQSALRKLRSNSDANSFEMASRRRDLADFDRLVYAEHPITNSYFALDVEAGCRRDCEVVHIRQPEAKVCTLLADRYEKETTAIHTLMEELRKCQSCT